jgi:hypothetical protein
MTKTISYEVPDFKGDPTLGSYGELRGDRLLDAILAGDGQAVTDFLEEFIAVRNAEFDADTRRANILKATLDAIPGIVAEVSLTGFKAFTNPDPRDRFRHPLSVNPGEGCEAGSCDLAAKYRFPPAPEGLTYKGFSLACQRHGVETLDARASFIAKGDDKYTYMGSDQHRLIKAEASDALKGVKAIKVA